MSEFDKELSVCLSKYTDEVSREVRECVYSVSKDCRDRISRDAPKKRGDYAKSWAIKTEDFGLWIKRTIYAKSPFCHLTHLLEYGHAIYGGDKRVPAYPHIKKNEEIIEKELEEKVEEAIKRAGR